MLSNIEINKCNEILSSVNKIWNLDFLADDLYNRFSKSDKIKKLNTPSYIIDKKWLENNIFKFFINKLPKTYFIIFGDF